MFAFMHRSVVGNSRPYDPRNGLHPLQTLSLLLLPKCTIGGVLLVWHGALLWLWLSLYQAHGSDIGYAILLDYAEVNLSTAIAVTQMSQS